MIVGLLYLQYAFNLLDENVVHDWVENPYWQVFTGLTYLQTEIKAAAENSLTLRQNDNSEAPRRVALQDLLTRTRRILNQGQKDKNKLYALHAPEVECISKGKSRTPDEFGVKVWITTHLKEGFVLGVGTMPGNPYDAHTLAQALEQRGHHCRSLDT